MNIAYSNFGKVKDLPTSAVGKLIGGKVEENIKAGFFTNACAIRLRMPLIIRVCPYHAMTVPHLREKTRSGTASMILIHIINLLTKLIPYN